MTALITWVTKNERSWLLSQRVQFSHSVMSDSLQPHGLQHARLPCPSPTPGTCSKSCPFSWWYQGADRKLKADNKFKRVIMIRVCWTARRSNLDIVHSKGNPSWIFIGRLMLKLKLQYFGHLMQRTNSLEKTLVLEKIEGRRRRGW